jgi:hypothetical protein
MEIASLGGGFGFSIIARASPSSFPAFGFGFVHCTEVRRNQFVPEGCDSGAAPKELACAGPNGSWEVGVFVRFLSQPARANPEDA